jgi:L-threonylcarbamoyladenylate synthase
MVYLQKIKMQRNCLSWYGKNAIKKASRVIRKGGIILGETDTVLGLMAKTSFVGKRMLDRIKNRSEKPYIILVSSADQARFFMQNSCFKHIERMISSCWPGPVTIIVKKRKRLPAYYGSKDGTIALRVPDHIALRKLIMSAGPIFSTSANKSTMPIPVAFDCVDKTIQLSCNLVMSNDVIPVQDSVASTILDCTQNVIKVLREGAYSVSELERIHGAIFEKNLL